MVPPLKALFAPQIKANEAKQHAPLDRAGLEAFIRFDTEEGAYAVPVTAVREVVDSFTITPYPEPVERHIGIVSLRGQVLPVIAPYFASCCDAAKPERLLVLEFTPDELFCVCAKRVQKILVERASDDGDPSVVNDQGRPVRLVDQAAFFASR